MIELDLYRLILAFIGGYFLTLSGSLSQLVTNNSLASPSTLGMDGAGVIIVLLSQVIYLFTQTKLSSEYISFIIIIFMTMVLIARFILTKKSSRNLTRGVNIQKLLLFGLGFNLFVGAIFSVLQFFFMALNYKFPAGLWFGSLKQYETSFLIPFVCLFIFIKILIIKITPKLEILNLGTSFSQGLGVDVGKIQFISLLIAFGLNAMIIAFFGVFSFLGLIFPHILRSFSFFRSSMTRELTLGPILCGLIFCIVDQFCYNFVIYGAELPVGMVSSVIGALFLMVLVTRSRISMT